MRKIWSKFREVKISSCKNLSVSEYEKCEFGTFSDIMEKVLYLKPVKEDSLIIDLYQEYPLILDNLNMDSVNNFKERFKLKNILFNGESKHSIPISPFMFYKLLDSFMNSHINSSNIIHILDEKKSIKSYIIPTNLNCSDFLKKNYGSDSFYFPLSGLNPVDVTVFDHIGETTLLHSSISMKKQTTIFNPYNFRSTNLSDERVRKESEGICINCGLCDNLCYRNIYPRFYYHYLKNELIDEVEDLLIGKCTKCGICSFVCPVHINLAGTIIEYLNNKEPA